MTSEIRTNSFKSRAGLSTVTMTDTGPIISGVVTATSFSGDGSNLTGISAGTSLSGSTNNTVCTVTGANAIQGEANLTFDGNTLSVTGTTNLYGNGGASAVWGNTGYTGHLTYDGSNNAVIRAASGKALIFQTDHVNERLRIDSSGRVLIGTTTEGHAAADDLTIATSGSTGITIRSGTSSEGNIFFSDATSGDAEYAGFITYDHNTNNMRFTTNATERFRIDSAGRVMIGTTTEGNGNADEFTISYINHAGVSGGDQGRCGMTIRSGDNTSGVTQNGYIYFSDGTSGANESMGVVAYEHSTDSMYLSTAQVARLRIDQNGDIGIGIAAVPQDSGARTLHVHSTTTGGGARAALRLTHGSTGSAASNGGFLGMDNNPDLYLYNQENGNLRFGSNGTERRRITSGGDILTAQNVTAFSWPSNPGHVIYPNGEYRSTSTNGTHIRCNRMNGDGHVAQWYRGQTNMVGYISITSSGTGYGSGSSDERTKKNIEAWDENTLDKFKSLTPKKFNFNWEDDSVSKHKGYIAQNEFEKFPEAYPKNNLTDCDNEYHMFVPTDMTVYLMKGLKEAAEKIEQLEQENIALRIRVTNLEDN